MNWSLVDHASPVLIFWVAGGMYAVVFLSSPSSFTHTYRWQSCEGRSRNKVNTVLRWLAGWGFTVATDSELPGCSFFKLHSLFTGSLEKLLSHSKVRSRISCVSTCSCTRKRYLMLVVHWDQILITVGKSQSVEQLSLGLRIRLFVTLPKSY